jgi:hypothetical protein
MRSVDSNILFSGNSVSWNRNTVDLWNISHFVCSGEVKYSETQTRNRTLQDRMRKAEYRNNISKVISAEKHTTLLCKYTVTPSYSFFGDQWVLPLNSRKS